MDGKKAMQAILEAHEHREGSDIDSHGKAIYEGGNLGLALFAQAIESIAAAVLELKPEVEVVKDLTDAQKRANADAQEYYCWGCKAAIPVGMAVRGGGYCHGCEGKGDE